MLLLSKIKPLLWLLFSAGGTVAAFFLPAFLLILSVAIPLHFISTNFLNYNCLKSLLTNSWFCKLCLFTFFALIFWHGMHRLFLTVVDTLHIKKYNESLALFFYGLTLSITLYVLALLMLL